MATQYVPNIASYNARDSIVTVNGEYITGLGEDMITIEKEEALAENTVGAMGDIVRSEINNGIYNVTVTVQVTSPKFGTLLALRNSSDFFPISVANKSLGINFSGTKAKMLELPSIALAATAEDVEFTFCVYDGVYN